MFMNIKAVKLIVCFVCVLLCAQSVFSASKSGNEKGFKITKNSVLNVGLSLIPEYESNITKASDSSTATDNTAGTTENVEIVSDLILHYSPYIKIKLDDQSKTVGMSLFFDYNHYLGLEDKRAAKQLSDLDIKSDFLGEFNKNGSVIFDFKNSFSRSATPDGQEISGKHKNILDNFVLGLGFKNIDDTLYGKIQAGVDFNYLEQSKDEKAYRDYNYVSVVGDLFGRWKFLPRTMIFMKAAFRYQDFYESSIRDDSRTMPLNIFAGLMGQVTPHISAKISGGYSAIFAKDTMHDYNANAELIFKYNEATFLNVGYLRSAKPSAYFQYYSTHRAYLNFKQKFARVFLAKVDFAYSYIDFGPSIEFNSSGYTFNSVTNTYDSSESSAGGTLNRSTSVPSGDRRDHLITLGPALSYNILNWLGLKISYEFEYRQTDYFKEVTAVFTNAANPASDYNRTVKTHFDFINHRVLFTIALDY